MRLFSKKKEEKPQELPPFKFPEFKKEQSVPSFDHFPPETEEIKQAVSAPPEFPEDRFKPEPMPKPASMRQVPGKEVEGNTLFVKIENFKTVKEKMGEIKEKISETEKILTKIDELRREEERELTMWNNDLNSIKSRLMNIDQTLFE